MHARITHRYQDVIELNRWRLMTANTKDVKKQEKKSCGRHCKLNCNNAVGNTPSLTCKNTHAHPRSAHNRPPRLYVSIMVRIEVTIDL
jgi:hypothetical protein